MSETTCKRCGKKAEHIHPTRREYLCEEHHHQEVGHPCPRCMKKNKRIGRLQIHDIREDEIVYVCDNCIFRESRPICPFCVKELQEGKIKESWK